MLDLSLETQVSGRSDLKSALIIATTIVLVACGSAQSADENTASRAHYLGNEGVMVEHGATKILFDPLFRRDYGEYELVPPDMERALLAGAAPWDGIDAVFISHYHGDHFDPGLMLSYVRAHPAIELYAPAQAVAGLRDVAGRNDDDVFERVHGLALDYGDAPVRRELDSLSIEAALIPHVGWPEEMTDVENVAFRVTLNGVTTVTHLGDADARDEHFAKAPENGDKRRSHLSLLPFWFFLSHEGREILMRRIDSARAVGIHVPKDIPDEPSERPIELQGVDLFTRPGETRDIAH